MSGTTQRTLAALSLALICIASPASAADDTVRVRGTIERVEGPVYVVKARDGAEVKVTLADNALVVAIVKAALSDIKPGSKIFIAAAKKQADGTLQAPRINYGKDGLTPPM